MTSLAAESHAETRMRIRLSIASALAGVLAGACGGEKDAAPLASEAATAPSSGMENAAEAGAADISFVLGCKAPFTPDATPATLAAYFGRENVIPETIDGPEGQPLNVTAIYPDDPDRRIEVVFANEEERTGLITVMVSRTTSLWKGPGGISIGAGIAEVEAANGEPFSVQGFGWDYGGFVSDWKDGNLTGLGGCSPIVRFVTHGDDVAPEIMGDGVMPMSDDPAVRKADPTVALFGIGWPTPR
jgi:hypothetical protein